ncbi:hypothetical protein CW304_17270 [Bacillus sp. UFRGS-B20]|nr:hypothetical protein CW304_17270 [Bacillus sp. UFRGS-B20]
MYSKHFLISYPYYVPSFFIRINFHSVFNSFLVKQINKTFFRYSQVEAYYDSTLKTLNTIPIITSFTNKKRP